MSKGVRETAKKLAKGYRFKRLVLVLIVIVMGLGVLMPWVERAGSSMSEGMIRSEWDGIYWAVTTVTGVGYGDMVPVTDGGRVVAMILETVGVVLFGTIVAMVAVEMLRYQEDFYMRRVMERLDEMEKGMSELKKHIDYLVKK